MRCFSRILLLLGIISVLACNQQYKESEELLFSQEGWMRSDTLTASWSAEDTSRKYDLLLDLVHARDYPFQNMYLEIKTVFPSGETVKDLVNVNVMNKGGKLFGKCGTDRCELRIWLQQNIQFGERGQYDVNIYQHSRLDTLPGVYSAAFRIAKAGNN